MNQKTSPLLWFVLIIVFGVIVAATTIYEAQNITTDVTTVPIPSRLPKEKVEVVDTTNWQKFEHVGYQLSFLISPETEIFSSNMGLSDAEEASSISVGSTKNNYFNLDPAPTPTIEKLGLQQTAKEVWKMNKDEKNPNLNNKTVSDLQETMIGGRQAYQFSVTQSYIDWGLQQLIPEKLTVVFFDTPQGEKLKIEYPSNSRIAQKMIETISFSYRKNTSTTQQAIDYCQGESDEPGMGGPSYPKSPQYMSLGYVGQIFTAADCGKDRLSEVAGSTYDKGVRIMLKAAPSVGLLQQLKALEFLKSRECTAETACTEWERENPILINNLLKLKNFSREFEMIDCTKCG